MAESGAKVERIDVALRREVAVAAASIPIAVEPPEVGRLDPVEERCHVSARAVGEKLAPVLAISVKGK
jgi:hypothetical protein